MNWEAIGSIAEFTGALATLAMLVYLTIQLRQNTKAIQSSSFHAANTSLSENFTRSPEETLLKYKDWDECNEAERLFQVESMGRHFTMFETMYYLNKDGTINPELWKSRSEHIRLMLEYPKGKVYWAERRHWFADSFKSYVDDILGDITGDA